MPHKVLVSEACWIEANNLVKGDFRADDRARRVYFSQCMLRNGYDADGNYRITSYNVCYTKLLRNGTNFKQSNF